MSKTKNNLNLLFKKINCIPQLAIITGSGGKVFMDYKAELEISYKEIFKSNSSNKNLNFISGHEGKLKLFKINNKNILVFSGRKHLYQGYDFKEVTENIKLISDLGIKNLIITNAAGGLNKKFKPGDLMLIDGFINLIQGNEKGVLNAITEKPFKIKTKLTKNLLKNNLTSGIYAAMLGPSYETYSEIKLLKNLGASAVGMSTVPEIIAAKSFGINFAAVSIITNVWDEHHKPSHGEVLRNAKKGNEKLNNLLFQVLNYV